MFNILKIEIGNGLLSTNGSHAPFEQKSFVVNQKNSSLFEFDCNGGRPLQILSAVPGQFELNQDVVEVKLNN